MEKATNVALADILSPMLLVLGARMCDIHLWKWTNHNINRNNTWSKPLFHKQWDWESCEPYQLPPYFPKSQCTFDTYSLYPDSCHYWNCTLACYRKGSFAAMSMPCSQRSLLLVHQPGTSETKSRFSAKQRQHSRRTSNLPSSCPLGQRCNIALS